jgi:hypothetical protein
MRMLVKYGKLGPARFASHRDFARAFERALRRGDIDMAYSSGFNPHQRVSYVNPSPTGAESVAEYVVIALKNVCDPDTVKAALAPAMPPGMPILEVSTLVGDVSFEASLWEIDISSDAEPVALPTSSSRHSARSRRIHLTDVDPATPRRMTEDWVSNQRFPTDLGARVEQALAEFDAAQEVLVTRDGKNGPRTFDAKAAVRSLKVVPPNASNNLPTPDGESVALQVVIQHTEPLVRPEDVVSALRAQTPDLDDGFPPRTKRLAQGSVSALLAIVGTPR